MLILVAVRDIRERAVLSLYLFFTNQKLIVLAIVYNNLQ